MRLARFLPLVAILAVVAVIALAFRVRDFNDEPEELSEEEKKAKFFRDAEILRAIAEAPLPPGPEVRSLKYWHEVKDRLHRVATQGRFAIHQGGGSGQTIDVARTGTFDGKGYSGWSWNGGDEAARRVAYHFLHEKHRWPVGSYEPFTDQFKRDYPEDFAVFQRALSLACIDIAGESYQEAFAETEWRDAQLCIFVLDPDGEILKVIFVSPEEYERYEKEAE